MAEEAATTVLLVDDHALVRRGFRRMLEDEPDICIVGEASDGHEGVEAALALKPHVVVMDFALPSMNGAVATRRIREAEPWRRVDYHMVEGGLKMGEQLSEPITA